MSLAIMNDNNLFIDSYKERYSRFGATSLSLLYNVERTVDSLCKLQTILTDLIRITLDRHDVIKECDDDRLLDPKQKEVELLQEVEIALKGLSQDLLQKKQSALRDRNLIGEHEDSVIRKMDKVIDEIDILKIANQDLRWAIMHHDADHDKDVGPFKNTEDFFNSLDS